MMHFGFGEGWQLSEADLTSRGACESLSLDLPRLTNGYPQAVQSVDPRAEPIKCEPRKRLAPFLDYCMSASRFSSDAIRPSLRCPAGSDFANSTAWAIVSFAAFVSPIAR